ncbi:secreted protein [Beggiatoa sp. PS]|nr:secreted protein [Beggiatoa sp. PS]
MTKYRLLMASILFVSTQANAELTLSLDMFQDSGDRDTSASYSSYGDEIDSVGSVADSSGYRLRLGLGSLTKSRIELYFSQYDVDDEGVINFNKEWEFGANKIITFRQKVVNPSLGAVTPFLKVGLGMGQADTDIDFTTDLSDDTTDNIYNIHLNLGGGVSYSFSDNVAITGNLEYIYRNWQDIEAGPFTIGITDSLFRLGVGVDVSF